MFQIFLMSKAQNTTAILLMIWGWISQKIDSKQPKIDDFISFLTNFTTLITYNL